MTKEEYVENIDWSGYDRKCAEFGLTSRGACVKAGVSDTLASHMKRGAYFPTTEALAKLCAFFRCGVNELVEFKGFEIKDRYKEPYFKPYEPEEDGVRTVTYEPLRMLFYSVYGDKWNTALTEFFSKVPGIEQTAAQKEHQEKALEYLREWNKRGVTKEHHGGPGTYYFGGLTGATRTKLRHDAPVNIRIIYNICKVLGCTPDYVMSYR